MNVMMTTKVEIIRKIDNVKTTVETYAKKDVSTSAAFYEAFFTLLSDFRQGIEELVLFEKLEASWNYEISFDYYSFQLKLVHRDISEHGDVIDAVIDQVFVLYALDIPTFTVDEFANRYSTDAMTIRQWLRRGKLRCAKKNGRDWVIPAVAVLPHRGFAEAGYYWEESLCNVPEEFEYLSECRELVISQNVNRKMFDISLDLGKVITLSASDKEKLELWLIANDKVYLNMFYEQSVIKDIMNCFI